MLSFLNVEKEFEAQTFRIDSTHQYFKTCEYELLTPSVPDPNLNELTRESYYGKVQCLHIL